MKILKILALLGAIVVLNGLMLVATPVFAENMIDFTCPDGHVVHNVSETNVARASGDPEATASICGSGSPTATQNPGTFQEDCNNGGVKLGINVLPSDNGCAGGNGTNPIYAYIRSIIKFVSGLFGIIAVLMVIISGFQYMTSAGSPDRVKKAKGRLANVILSIIVFSMLFGILSYLIPGGVL